MPVEEIVVLANSRKLNGRCVAGISTSSGEWVRPVSGLPRGELERYHYEIDERPPEVLDVVRFGFERRLNDVAQPENVLLDDEEWQLVGQLDPADAYARLSPRLVDGPELLGNRGTFVTEAVAAAGVDSSLALVESSRPLSFEVREYKGTLKSRVTFQLGSARYDLPLTDCSVGPRLKKAGLGSYTQGDLELPSEGRSLLTVSLGEPFKGQRWKLAAALMFLP